MVELLVLLQILEEIARDHTADKKLAADCLLEMVTLAESLPL